MFSLKLSIRVFRSSPCFITSRNDSHQNRRASLYLCVCMCTVYVCIHAVYMCKSVTLCVCEREKEGESNMAREWGREQYGERKREGELLQKFVCQRFFANGEVERILIMKNEFDAHARKLEQINFWGQTSENHKVDFFSKYFALL